MRRGRFSSLAIAGRSWTSRKPYAGVRQVQAECRKGVTLAAACPTRAAPWVKSGIVVGLLGIHGNHIPNIQQAGLYVSKVHFELRTAPVVFFMELYHWNCYASQVSFRLSSIESHRVGHVIFDLIDLID